MLKQSQLDLCGRVDFTREVPLLGRDEGFSFACAGLSLIHISEPTRH